MLPSPKNIGQGTGLQVSGTFFDAFSATWSKAV
jgi:hypothetical protein